ncbi:MAG: glycosyltransferase family 4 protein [Saprospiraceae bacterium]
MKTIILSANTSWYLYNYRASTIRALLGGGYRVVCLSPGDAYSARLEALGAEWMVLRIDNQGSNPFADAGLWWRLFRVYRLLRPVLVFHFTLKNNVYGTWAARLAGIPAVNIISGLGTAFIRTGFVPAVARLLYRLSQPLARVVYCQNEEDYSLLVAHGIVPERRLRRLPGSGVDLARYAMGRWEARRVGEPFRFLYAGRMLADKGLYELMEALAVLNRDGLRATLTLCGFSEVDNVSAIPSEVLEVWKRRPDVHWLGPRDDMEQVYAQSDCMVLPSYREGLPKGLLEAAAMGLPLVATDVPGCRQVVRHGVNGLLCAPRDARALELALAEMLEMSEERRGAMGAAGRAFVESHYDEQQVVREALAVVEEVLGERSHHIAHGFNRGL